MEDYKGIVPTLLDQPPAPRRRGRRCLLIGVLVLAFTLALGAGVLLGSSNSVTQAATLTTANSQSLGMQGAQRQCKPMTVSSVHGNTIVATTASGSSVVIHTTSKTHYTEAGKTITMRTIKVGTPINVTGTHNSNGSIAATSINIGC